MTSSPGRGAANESAAVLDHCCSAAIVRCRYDPALWIHPTDPAKSLILGTDKSGSLYTFDLSGNILADRTKTELARPNNVDWQYRITGDGDGGVRFEKVRQFGAFSGGEGEIEAIAVDDESGYVYYSDEWAGVRKYAADPDAVDANTQLAILGTSGFKEDREGISIYKTGPRTGYILVSDQQANLFRVFRREGTPNGPHDQTEIAAIPVSTLESDGSEITSTPLGPDFPRGLFVAMSEGKVFQLYRWEDLEARLQVK